MQHKKRFFFTARPAADSAAESPKKTSEESHASSPAPAATGERAGAGGMRALPKSFCGGENRRRNAGAAGGAVQSGATANAGAVRLPAARGRAAGKKQNSVVTSERRICGIRGGVDGGRENTPRQKVFFAAGKAGKKRGGIPDTFGRRRHKLAALAGRAQNAPGGNVFFGGWKRAAECGAERAARKQSPHPRRPVRAQKKGK